MSYHDKSDDELVEAASMLVAQLSEIQQHLEARSIDCSLMTYGDGRVVPHYTRVQKTELYKGQLPRPLFTKG